MRKSFFITIVLFTLLSSLSMAQFYTDSESIIPEIKKGKFDKELVEIEGVVEFYEKVPQKTTLRYWLRDYWGKLIPVQSIQEHPEVNKKYRIEGTVQISSTKLRYNNITTYHFIDEHTRVDIGGKGIEIIDTAVNNETNKTEIMLMELNSMLSKKQSEWYYDYSDAKQLLVEAKFNLESNDLAQANRNLAKASTAINNPSFSRLFYLAIILLLLIIAIIIALFSLFSSKQRVSKSEKQNIPQHREFDQSKLTVKAPEPAQTIGETVKIQVPPQGTLKVLKGRMEIIEGETELKEIRFYSLPNNTSQEFSFGRNTGAPYQHIQISHPTVSRDQARILHNNGTYTIINKADPVSKNATKLNGVDIPLNEAKNLKDGDKITMGVITMIYRDH